MYSFRLMKWMRAIICMILAVCFLAFPEAGRNGAKAESGERHWYTFTVLPWGLVSSANVDYPALYGPYNISEQNAVAIGRVKGMTTEIKVFTNDPEERLIWSISPNHFTGVFLRSDFTLPDPATEPEAGDLALVAGDQVFPLTDASLAEMKGLRENIETTGVRPGESGMEFDLNSRNLAEIVFVYHELPGLQRWLLLSILKDGDRMILLSWKECDPDSGNSGYEAERFVELDPGSEIYREASEAIEAAG